MRIVYISIIAFTLFACRTVPDELLGHWHSVPSEDGYYYTFDISDSTTLVNKYDLETGEPETNRFDKNGNEEIVFRWESFHDYEIIYDTMILNEAYKFVKVKESNHLKDHFLNSKVRLQLPSSNIKSKPKLPYLPYQLSHLFIGPPKDYFKPNEHLINVDSTCFQTWDVLVGYDHLKDFVLDEDSKIPSDDNIWLIIHSDSTTSQETIESVRTRLKPLGVINGFILSRYNYELDQIEYEEFE